MVRDRPLPPLGSLERWAAAARTAREPCLVIDELHRIVVASTGACELLGLGDPDAAVGLSLFAGVLRLVDFTAAAAPLSDGELEKIPPVLAFTSERLARGLLRIQSGDTLITVDAIATPLSDGPKTVGSLTFLVRI